jgi:Mrp family chromosome partitioning ATPase
VSAGGPPGKAGDSLVPVFEATPAFEEDLGAHIHPGTVARAVLDGRSAAGRQCRVLAKKLLALGRDKRLRRIGVAGATAGEGSTTVALGLAQAMADDGAGRVLLLEGDVRHPALDERLGLSPATAGLLAFLHGTSDVPVLRRSGRNGFWLLAAGPGSPSDLASPRLDTLLGAADRVFDLVVVDLPPLVGSREALALQERLDGVVYVVRSRRTPRDTVRRAQALVRPEKRLGVVLSAHRDILPRRRGSS